MGAWGADMGIIMFRFMQLRFAAVPLIAGAIIALTTASVWAFSQQTLGPGESGNYNFDYPKDQATTGQNAHPPNGSGFHFSVEAAPSTTFGGFRGFQGNSSNASPPDYYSRPLGNSN